jgi:alpha-glucosidase (family GH31 glycosyl hydrolase)
MVKENVKGYADANIPLEGIWLDIPYMDGYSDFTVNQTAFGGLKEWTQEI